MLAQGTSVRSVEKALELLNVLADASAPLSLAELSHRTGWPKSTIYGLLSSLRHFMVVEQSEVDGRYRLGIRLFELGNIVAGSISIIALAKEHLRDIALQIGENANLGMLKGNEVLYLDQADSGMSLRVVAQVGMHAPLYCTAMGKAMLAHLPPAQLRSTLQSLDYKAFTPHTIVDQQRLSEEIALTRSRGYAIENGEMRIGLRAVAAPVFDSNSLPQYAISVAGMFRHITDERFLLAQELVKTAAQRISATLGYRATPDA